ncbi:MAG: hypothetical protein P8J45_09065 [Phycisphaerales bacterium]|nr:hypothetical protein [Phycisphaerales bacterium]
MFHRSWHAFKTHYGQVLGYGVVFIVVGLAVNILTHALGYYLQSSLDIQPGGLTAVMISTAASLVLLAVIVIPLITYLHYGILRRLRGTNEPRRPGRYGMILAIAIIQMCVFAPGFFLAGAADPGKFSNIEVSFAEAAAGIKLITESTAVGPDGKRLMNPQELVAKQAEIKKEFEAKHIAVKPGLMTIAVLLWIIACVVSVLSILWAYMLALDPRAKVDSAVDAISRGWALAAPARLSIIGFTIVIFLILVGTFALCCLPLVFLGYPLMLASVPAVYMLMQGEPEPRQG